MFFAANVMKKVEASYDVGLRVDISDLLEETKPTYMVIMKKVYKISAVN